MTKKLVMSVTLAVLGTLLLVPSLSAQVGTIEDGQIVLEATKPLAAGLEECDILHQVRTCDNYHFTPIDTASERSLEIGGTLHFDDKAYVLEWQGPGFHLDNGMIVEPLDASGSGHAGQRWVEVYPQEGRIHTSQSWSDSDRNGVVNRSDTIQLDVGALAVEDVRLHLRLRPVGR